MNIYKSNSTKEIELKEPENQDVTMTDPDNKNPFYRKAIYWGAGAGLLMGLFVFLPGFYINGDHPGYGFVKYLVLIPVIYLFLRSVQQNTAYGKTFRPGFAMGLVLSASAALVSALAALLVGGQTVIRGRVEEASDLVINRMTLATMSFFETIVAGIIITFILLQFVKETNTIK